MQQFLVSARKYRPQLFDSVIGQQHITTTLQNAIKSGQLAHAFLFCGPRGVGKTTCARILAKTINCLNITPEGEACNNCASCNSFNTGGSFNIHELDAASNNSVDDIRQLVEQVRFAPQAGKYKVYIIDEVHMLSTAAFNAFLKTLEEPPSYAIFILATTEKHKILPTILSRCQIFDFKRISVNDIVEHLENLCNKESINAEKAALQLIAQKSDGCLRDALSILDKISSFTAKNINYTNTIEHLNILDADYYFRMFDTMLSQDLAEALLIYDEINEKGFECEMFLNGFSEFFRNLLVCKDEKAARLLESVESFQQKYITAARAHHPAIFLSALQILSEAEINIKLARNKKLFIELTLIKLCYLKQAILLSAEPGGDELSKKKLINTTQPVSYRKIKSFVALKQNAEIPAAIKTQKKLIIESAPAISKTAKPAAPAAKEPPTPVPKKIASLTNLREKIKTQVAQNGEMKTTALNLEKLQQAWAQFTQQLKFKNNLATQSFEMSVLEVADEQSFIITCPSNIDQRFIEQERHLLIPFLQSSLHCATIKYLIQIEEKMLANIDYEAPLSKTEQLQKLEQLYPLVAQLRASLRLYLE